jgi:hypothetical protein
LEIDFFFLKKAIMNADIVFGICFVISTMILAPWSTYHLVDELANPKEFRNNQRVHFGIRLLGIWLILVIFEVALLQFTSTYHVSKTAHYSRFFIFKRKATPRRCGGEMGTKTVIGGYIIMLYGRE